MQANAQLVRQKRVAAAVEERRRLARELHDSVTQTLYSVSLVAAALPRVLERSPVEAKRSVVHLRNMTVGRIGRDAYPLVRVAPRCSGDSETEYAPAAGSRCADRANAHSCHGLKSRSIRARRRTSSWPFIALRRKRLTTSPNTPKRRQAMLALQMDETRSVFASRTTAGDSIFRRDQSQGLGLKIMEERAQHVGATLDIESTPGQGDDSSGTMASMTETGRIHVMIVDDHRLVRDGLNLLLSTFDEFEIVGMAEDGEQAVALCPSLRPDVILMDIVMPNLDGPDATVRILAEYPNIRVIALTSFVEDVQVRRAIERRGYRLFVEKRQSGAVGQCHPGCPSGSPDHRC